MPKLKVGDTISCRVKSALIVSPYRAYDEIKSFVIVATDEHGYYLFVPHYLLLKNSFVVDKYKIKNLNIDKKYLDENAVYIQENLVASVQARNDGLACKICREFFPYSVANQDDGTLICYACRQNPYR